MRKTFNILLIPIFVGILKIVPCFPVFIFDFDDFSFHYAFWDRKYLLVCNTCKDLIRATLLQSYKSNPFLIIYIKPYNITVKRFRSFRSFRPYFCFSCKYFCAFFFKSRYESRPLKQSPPKLDRASDDFEC